ncbi:PAS domain S-box protein [candidate division KSB1 bacterium]|nr:PAS domain S-box protein [candidate division KSB1 bacterium]
MKHKAKQYVNQLKEISKTFEDLIWDMIKDLRESEQRYRSIVEFAVDAIITIDTDFRITSWNRGASNIFGYTENEALKQNLDDLIVRTDVETEAFKLSQKVMKGESIRNLEAIRYTKDGSSRHVLVSAAPIKTETGKVEAASIMYKDITELKRAHEQLVQTEKQATLGVIAGNIGHELNNLIGGLMLHAKLLQQYVDNPAKVSQVAELILSNLEKIALHGKNLLSLSRPTKPRFEPLDLNQVLLETTETLELTGVLKHFEIEKNLCDEICMVHGDRNLLEQVIRNLEINAAHAMKEGQTLVVRTRTNGNGRCEMDIIDTGSGIPQDIQEKIFEPFFTTKAEGQGTGLGLPIVKDIVEKHKGQIKILSEQGKGTTVTVSLPLVKT